MRRVVVAGSGVAGTAAALEAARAGADVTLIDGGPGASTLATGALDFAPWTRSPRKRPLGAAAREVLACLGGCAVPDAGALLATSAGVLRIAAGHDEALVDLAPLAHHESPVVGVVRCPRPGWDADALARAWGGNFIAIDAAVVRHSDERTLPDADFAARHDDGARLAWLAERVREALGRAGADAVGALVLPPSLGVDRARAAELSAAVGLPCGEALGLPGGPSGLRFARARDRALAAAGVRRVVARVTRVHRGGSPPPPQSQLPSQSPLRWRLTLDADEAALDADAVVFALGGPIAGAVEYAPSESMPAAALPPGARPPFRLTLDAPLVLGAGGRPLESPGTLFGVAPEGLALPYARDSLLERVGVLVDGGGRAADGLFAAGDFVADAARTWLGALESGVRAGAAAGDPLSPGGTPGRASAGAFASPL